MIEDKAFKSVEPSTVTQKERNNTCNIKLTDNYHITKDPIASTIYLFMIYKRKR